MNSQEFAVNIDVLQHLGWFVGEVESDEFDVMLECCRPDGTVLEQVPVTPFLLSIYDEEEGGLEERLWFFAPRYTTSLDTLITILKWPYEWEVSKDNTVYTEPMYDATVTSLEVSDEDGEVYEAYQGWYTTGYGPALALAVAYLKCEGIYASNYRWQLSD